MEAATIRARRLRCCPASFLPLIRPEFVSWYDELSTAQGAYFLTEQSKTIFFGANDASLPNAPNKQHIPLDEYKSNLEKIVTHPQIVAHNPRIILIAPPPINEHLWWPRDQENGYTTVSRRAATTRKYADAVVEVGAKLNLPVVNLWNAFMAKTNFKIDEWKAGDLLPGSLDTAQNDALVELMYDGKNLELQNTYEDQCLLSV